jgi:hypothetical protein
MLNVDAVDVACGKQLVFGLFFISTHRAKIER